MAVMCRIAAVVQKGGLHPKGSVLLRPIWGHAFHEGPAGVPRKRSVDATVSLWSTALHLPLHLLSHAAGLCGFVLENV